MEYVLLSCPVLGSWPSPRRALRGPRKAEITAWRRVVLARKMGAAKAWLPAAMGSTSIRGQREGVGGEVMSRKQSGVCVCLRCRGGEVEHK